MEYVTFPCVWARVLIRGAPKGRNVWRWRMKIGSEFASQEIFIPPTIATLAVGGIASQARGTGAAVGGGGRAVVDHSVGGVVAVVTAVVASVGRRRAAATAAATVPIALGGAVASASEVPLGVVHSLFWGIRKTL